MRSSIFKLVAVSLFFSWALNAARADQVAPLEFGPFELLPSGDGMVMVGAGEYNAFRQRDPGEVGASSVLNLEYRFGRKFFYLGFALGGLANTDGGKFVYLGNYADIRYRRIIVTPLLSVGAYSRGSGPDLGGTLQFRSAVTVDYEFDNRSRLGVRLAHTSNASIHDENPGLNEILFTYAFPF
ncbi:MAG: acyloxyacyl hydrolase [Gammaproteobacteria bacterium]|nr:acyloxyacyl hydrolase [Gammaproteobacteria bacterium]